MKLTCIAGSLLMRYSGCNQHMYMCGLFSLELELGPLSLTGINFNPNMDM